VAAWAAQARRTRLWRAQRAAACAPTRRTPLLRGPQRRRRRQRAQVPQQLQGVRQRGRGVVLGRGPPCCLPGLNLIIPHTFPATPHRRTAHLHRRAVAPDLVADGRRRALVRGREREVRRGAAPQRRRAGPQSRGRPALLTPPLLPLQRARLSGCPLSCRLRRAAAAAAVAASAARSGRSVPGRCRSLPRRGGCAALTPARGPAAPRPASAAAAPGAGPARRAAR